MEDWQKKRSEYETEKDLLKTCTDYLKILKNQGKVWFWHDKTNDTDLLKYILSEVSCYVPEGIMEDVIKPRLYEWLRKNRNAGGLPDLVVWVEHFDYIELSDGWHKTDVQLITVFTFELKSPKGSGKLTEGQKEFMAFLEGSVHTHHILNDFDKFKNIIDELVN